MNTNPDHKAALTFRITDGIFEELYLAVRQKEGRIYSDDQLRKLPDIGSSDMHENEWKVRAKSAERLLKYLSKKNKPLNILEIGCGNGWLSAKLSEIKDTTVIGQDINKLEIGQARRTFQKGNLQFTDAVFDPQHFGNKEFDVIVFAASIQYFFPIKEILEKAQDCLATDGEIHIIDTHFYDPATARNAAGRTFEYYTKLGYPELADYYFHHQLDDLGGFAYKILYNSDSLLNRLMKAGPFYWICIKKAEL